MKSLWDACAKASLVMALLCECEGRF